jgi:hypothetical protein
MGFWLGFWTVLLIAALAVFAGLAIAVTIGGLFDIRSMFRAIAAQSERRDDETASSELAD